jgi:hypothetical protein
MKPSLLFVLLLATGLALAGDAQQTQPTDATARSKAKTGAAKPAKTSTRQPAKPGGTTPAEAAASPQTKTDQGTPGAPGTPDEDTQAAPAEGTQDRPKEDPSLGMSILGNQEAPKALVIVPWKRSEMGKAPGISTMLDDSRLPVDKEVFMRMLTYYEVMTTPTP